MNITDAGGASKPFSEGEVAFLQADWPAPPGVQAVVSLRAGGVSGGGFASLNLGDHVGDDPTAVAENRRRLRAALALPAEPRWLRQVHGTQVVALRSDQTDPSAVPEADAAWTGERGVVCAILTADCLPVLICDDSGSTVAAAHAGWRGLCAGVLENTVRTLPVPADRLLAWLGPAIGPQAFEVGPEVRAAFVTKDAEAVAHFAPVSGGKFLADLCGLARQRLTRAGVTRIHGGSACTVSEPGRFFSHRRDGGGGTGRLASLIWRG